MKRVSLELGGKGANIIFADADEKAVTRGVRHCFNNSGQSCNAPTRMLVERAIYDQAVETARAVAEKTEVGPADIEGRQIGPVVSEAQFNKIQYPDQARHRRRRHVDCGWVGRPDGLNRGHFVRPTIFADVTPEMTIWKEEIFGPVLTMTPFDYRRRGNRPWPTTRLWADQLCPDRRQIPRTPRGAQLRSGMVEMNGKFGGAGSPFGGMKHSGNGREGGDMGS